MISKKLKQRELALAGPVRSVADPNVEGSSVVAILNVHRDIMYELEAQIEALQIDLAVFRSIGKILGRRAKAKARKGVDD